MPERVRITDVSPRDGLQNEPGVIPTAEKVRLVELLCATGVDEVEVTSFVSAKWVPQLGDGADVLKGAGNTVRHGGWGVRGAVWSALVPNEKGMLAVVELNGAGTQLVDKVAVFTAASETFARRNTNASIAETLERFRPVFALASEHGLPVRAYISCVSACPFEGPVDPRRVADLAGTLLGMGAAEVDLGDTIGAGTPDTVLALLGAVSREIAAGASQTPRGGFVAPLITLHLHDTFGRAAECVRAALDAGVRSFDGSVAGLGGCPYASTPGKRAPGNIATETLVRTIHEAGYETGVDLDKLAEAAAFAREIVSKSRAGGGA